MFESANYNIAPVEEEYPEAAAAIIDWFSNKRGILDIGSNAEAIAVKFRSPGVLGGTRLTDWRVFKFEIGRNEQCPCNSGRKFKKCCGK